MSPKALYIVAHAPSRTARQAGQKTAQKNLEGLVRGYQVDTVILCSATIEELLNSRSCDTTIRVVAFSQVGKILSILFGLIKGIPPRFSTRTKQGVAREIAALVKQRRYELVWLEFSQVGWLLLPMAKAGHPAMKTVLSLHDIQSELVSRKSWAERLFFKAWTRSYERRLLLSAGLVRVLSEKDRDLVRELCGPHIEVEVSPPVISEFVHRVNRRKERIRPYSMLFWGAMNRTENYSAALRFLRRVFPPILARFSEAVLLIVGANPPAKIRALASSHVIVTGFVDDPTPYFQQASIGVVPLSEGAGIKLKTLEMLATGMKVVSTSVGAEGVPASDNLIIADLHNMANRIIDLFSETHGFGIDRA